jgi:TrkA family protein
LAIPRHFLNRVQTELRVNVRGLREAILALSERVNRKVQVLKLDWQAAELSDHIEAVHQELGRTLAMLLASADGQPLPHLPTQEALQALRQAMGQLGTLRHELVRIDGLVRELEAEILRDDLLKFQQDLTSRALTLERYILPAGAPAAGRSFMDLGLGPDVRLVAIFRGPTLLDRTDQIPLREGDTVVVLGSSAELKVAQLKFILPIAL